MKQDLPPSDVQTVPSKKVKVLRTIALILIFLLLFPFWNKIIEALFGVSPSDSIYTTPTYIFWQICQPAIWIIVYVLFFLLSSNQTVKTAIIVLSVTQLLCITSQLLCVISGTPDIALIIVTAILLGLRALASIYFFSTVLSNTNSHQKVWIALLLVFIPVDSASLCGWTTYVLFELGSLLWGITVSVFSAIAYFYMIRSDVFSGPVKTEENIPLFSFNRYFGMGLAVVIVALVIFKLYFNFALVPLLSN